MCCIAWNVVTNMARMVRTLIARAWAEDESVQRARVVRLAARFELLIAGQHQPTKSLWLQVALPSMQAHDLQQAPSMLGMWRGTKGHY